MSRCRDQRGQRCACGGRRQGVLLSLLKFSHAWGRRPTSGVQDSRRKDMTQGGVLERVVREQGRVTLEVPWPGPEWASPSLPLHRPGFSHVAREAGNATCCVCHRGESEDVGQGDSCHSSKAVMEEGAVCKPLPLSKAKRLEWGRDSERKGVRMAGTGGLSHPELGKPRPPYLCRALWGIGCLLGVSGVIPGTTQDHRERL